MILPKMILTFIFLEIELDFMSLHDCLKVPSYLFEEVIGIKDSVLVTFIVRFQRNHFLVIEISVFYSKVY